MSQLYGRVHIRWMIRRDMAEVLAIEAATAPTPLDEAGLVRVLGKRNVIGMVAEDHGGKIVGFMVYSNRRDHIQIHRLVVSPEHVRRGVGRAMMEKLQSKLHSQPLGRTQVRVNVRERDDGAIRFLSKLGLMAFAVSRGHYRDTGEDAYQFLYVQPEAARHLCVAR